MKGGGLHAHRICGSIPPPCSMTDLASQVLSRFPAIRARRSRPCRLKSLHRSDFACGRLQAHKGEGERGGCGAISAKNPTHRLRSRHPPPRGEGSREGGFTHTLDLPNHTPTLLDHGLGKPSPISLPSPQGEGDDGATSRGTMPSVRRAGFPPPCGEGMRVGAWLVATGEQAADAEPLTSRYAVARRPSPSKSPVPSGQARG